MPTKSGRDARGPRGAFPQAISITSDTTITSYSR
jgi:hypothetical protein